jgi:predicted nucleotide-binding protein
MIITGNTPDSDFQKAYMNGMTRAQAMLRSAIKEFEDYELQESNDLVNAAVINDSPNDGKHGRQIFVVHGHDNEMKQTVARFLERLGFEPIILHEHANAGDTIIEKFERHSDVTFAVVLLSPDDVGSASVDKKNLQPRARQNVVLELGYFIGRLGRSHVCALVRGQVEIPSDFHGVAYVPFEGDAWKLHVVKELKHLGYEIDANKVF